MTITVPAVILLGLAVALMVRSRQVRGLELVIVAGFGFFLAATGWGHELASFLASLFGNHTTVPAPVVPSPPPTHGVIGA